MAGVGFDPFPLWATRFKRMTECKKTGASGHKEVTGKDRKTQVGHYFLYIGSTRELQQKCAASSLFFLLSERQFPHTP